MNSIKMLTIHEKPLNSIVSKFGQSSYMYEIFKSKTVPLLWAIMICQTWDNITKE
jgi:hypothetical protein